MRLTTTFFAFSLFSALQAQEPVLYGDWIDSANVAKANKDLASTQRFYHAAFKRSKPLVKHTLDCARISWLMHDTLNCKAYTNLSLDLGISGPTLESDSVLSEYWGSPVAASSHVLWEKYKAMELSVLKAELEAMFKEDQDVRSSIDWEKADSPDSLVRRSVWAPIEALDDIHTNRVIEIIKEFGIPNVHQVGLTGNKMVFFAFIHANDLEVINDHALMFHNSVENGDSPGCWYAYIIDRIMARTSRVTMYCTTSYFIKEVDTTYFTAVSSKYVDLLREEMGLPRTRTGKNFY